MHPSPHLEPVPEINAISSLLSEHYDAPHMTLYYEAGLSEPEEDSEVWSHEEIKGPEVRKALTGFVDFLKASLKEFEADGDPRVSSQIKAYLETLPKIETALRTFLEPAERVLRQTSEFDDPSVEGMDTFYFLIEGRWFYLSYGRVENLE